MPRDNTYRETFESLGEFLACVAAARADGIEHSDRRLFAAATGSGESVPSDGGFLVQDEQADQLHGRLYSTGEILRRVTRWPATRLKFRVPLVDETSRANGSRFGGIVMNFVQPGDPITASKPKFAARDMTRRKLAGIVHVTDELLADFPALEATFSRLFGLEGSFVIEREIVNGVGGDRPLGILNSGSLITIAKETGQLANTIVVENIVNMYGRLWAASKRRATWIVNADVASQLYPLTLGVGTAPLFTWEQNGPRLMGLPVIEVEYCPTLGSAGDIILADLAEYLNGDPEEFTVDISPHVRFLNAETAFRIRMRVDGLPAWDTPTTPLNGAATVSPFVALAARA